MPWAVGYRRSEKVNGTFFSIGFNGSIDSSLYGQQANFLKNTPKTAAISKEKMQRRFTAEKGHRLEIFYWHSILRKTT